MAYKPAPRRFRCALLTLLVFGFFLLLGFKQSTNCFRNLWNSTERKSSPIIFVGGVLRSGTTLMRVLLDVHPWIRCGAEGMVIKPILKFRHNMNDVHVNWSSEAGIYPNLLDGAITKYIRHIVEGMGDPAKILCYKRPEVILYMEYLAGLFPDSKFVLMLRDGRAVAVSLKRWGKNTTPYLDAALHTWMKQNIQLIKSCQNLGPKRCIIVRYELLVLNPERELKLLTDFLEVPWDPVMLHHEQLIGNVSRLNPFEPSTQQVKKTINIEALTKWFKSDPVMQNLTSEAPQKFWLLRALGYLDLGLPPDYSKLPREIVNMTALQDEK